METATEILVIITSSVLVLFLLLAIVGAVQLILLVRQIRHIIKRAESVAETVEAASEAFGKAAVPAAIGKVVGSFLQGLTKDKRRR